MPNQSKGRAAKRAFQIAPWLAVIGLLVFISAGVSAPPPGAEPPDEPVGTTAADAAELVALGPTNPEPASADAGPMLDPRVDPTLALPVPALQPSGFPDQDRFPSISEACVQLTKELVPRKWTRPVYDYCEHRSFHSSRNNVIQSRVDKTQLHDRDRPFAWRFYNRGIITGTLDPDNCHHHQIDKTLKHPREGKQLAKEWPFGKPKMTEALRHQWLRHPHDMERFGTRGPHDNHLGTAVYWLPGCYPPEALDRNDVNATVTILRSIAICESYGCASKGDIRKRWRHGPSRKWKKAKAAAPAQVNG